MMIVKGKTYRTNPPGILKLSTLRAVKRDFDLTWADVMAWFEAKPVADLEKSTTFDLMVDPPFEAWVYAWVVNADGLMSRDEFEAMEISDIEFSEDPDAKAPELPDEPPDPTTASGETDSGPADAKPAKDAKPRKGSTKTSKQPLRLASSS